MADEKNPWRTNGVREVYDNPWIGVAEHDVVMPNGAPGIYGVVSFKSLALAILPIDAQGNTRLVGQWRYALGRYSWELPEGGGPKTRDPLESARRELKEETGLAARDWLKILEMDMSNSVSDERAIGYLAWNLTEGAPEPDPTEVLAQKTVSFAEALDMIAAGEIEDSLSIAMLLRARQAAERGELPEALAGILLS